MKLRVRDISMYAADAGRGEPILFIHGFPLNGDMWLPTAQRLGDGWRCIIPDLRGHGRTEATDRASMADYADDLAALLEALGEQRPVVVVGLSLGGYVAFEFFRRHRSRVRAMVLADTRANPDTPEAAARREEAARSVLEMGSEVVADAMVDRLFAPGCPRSIRDAWLAVMTAAPRRGVAAAARAMAARADSRPTLSRIDCPTLVVVGESDELTPPDLSREMQSAIPGARLEIIPGAGHMPPVEQPDAFAGALRQFQETLGPR